MKKIIASIMLFLIPLASHAEIRNFDDITGKFTNIVNTVTVILISFAVLYIIIQVVRYLIIGGSDPEKRKLAGWSILYGVIGLAVIISVWGLVRIVTTTFKTDNNVPTNEFPRAPIPPTI